MCHEWFLFRAYILKLQGYVDLYIVVSLQSTTFHWLKKYIQLFLTK
jgi:hypothetical protein